MLTQPHHWHMHIFFLKPLYVGFSSLQPKKTWLKTGLEDDENNKGLWYKIKERQSYQTIWLL